MRMILKYKSPAEQACTRAGGPTPWGTWEIGFQNHELKCFALAEVKCERCGTTHQMAFEVER